MLGIFGIASKSGIEVLSATKLIDAILASAVRGVKIWRKTGRPESDFSPGEQSEAEFSPRGQKFCSPGENQEVWEIQYRIQP